MFDYSAEFAKIAQLGEAVHTDKVTYSMYHRFYARILPLLPEGPILEIGYGDGASVKFWRQLFPEREYFCLDLDVEYEEDLVHVIKCDQSSLDSLQSALSRLSSKRFALIVDDGSHHPDHQILAFNTLFPLLKDLGSYVIEDVETSFWRHTNVYGYPLDCGIYSRSGLIERLKDVIDFMNRQFLPPHNLQSVSERLLKSHLNPSLCLQINDISFAHNLVSITKADSVAVATMSRDYRFQSNILSGPLKKLSYYLPSTLKKSLKSIFKFR